MNIYVKMVMKSFLMICLICYQSLSKNSLRLNLLVFAFFEEPLKDFVEVLVVHCYFHMIVVDLWRLNLYVLVCYWPLSKKNSLHVNLLVFAFFEELLKVFV